MAPAPFLGTITFQGQDKQRISYPVTVSDVNAAMYVFQDGNNDVVLPTNHGNLYLIDLILSAAGTDTRTATIFVNGKPTGEIVQNSANLATNLSRQFMSCPMGIAGGARLRFTQVT